MSVSMGLTKKSFQTMVRDRVKALDITYVEAALLVCEAHNLQPEDVARYIDGEMKQTIETEARSTRMLKPQEQIDVTTMESE